jgi:hypothetical protein
MRLARSAGVIWLTIAGASADGDELEHLLPRLAGVLRFTSDLDARLRREGLGGFAPTRELHGRLAALVAALAPDVAHAEDTVARLVASLRAMEASLAALRRVKGELARVA